MTDYILNKYNLECARKTDIHEHLPTIYRYAKECDSVFETGVRGCVSSWALGLGLIHNDNKFPKIMLLNDISPCNIQDFLDNAKKTDLNVSYIWKNNLKLDLKENFDLTFIDTWHVYAQLIRELNKFSKITNKYIILHDTTVDGIHGETIRKKMNASKQSKDSGFPIHEIKKGLQFAVDDFLKINSNWYLKEKFTNNNGLTILAKR